MEEQKTKFDWKQLVIVVVAMLATAGVVGGGMYVLNGSCKKDFETTKNALNQTLDTFKSTVRISRADTAVATTNTVYANSNGKFSLALSKDFAISEGIYGCEGRCGQQIEVIKKQSDSKYKNLFVTISYYVYPEAKGVNEVLQNIEAYNGATNVKDMQIAGTNAKYFTQPGMGGDEKYYCFLKNGIGYTIQVSSFQPEGQDTAVGEILSTLKLN